MFCNANKFRDVNNLARLQNSFVRNGETPLAPLITMEGNFPPEFPET
jgi:hypothetical protein